MEDIKLKIAPGYELPEERPEGWGDDMWDVLVEWPNYFKTINEGSDIIAKIELLVSGMVVIDDSEEEN